MVVILLSCLRVRGQELYVYTEPASNMPAHSISARLTGNFIAKDQSADNRFMQRYSPEIMLGINKKWMIHAGASFADMHTSNFRWESVYTYIKYRFLSIDEVHQHFRMAAFADVAYTRSPFEFDDVSLQGDKSGVAIGLVATQLVNKLAVSATVSHMQVLDASRNDKVLYTPARSYQAVNYALSAGYLLFPRNYTDYKQTNVNLYIELLGQQTLDRKTNYWDAAPAVQFIFNSNSKLNIGYRFQVAGNMNRMSRQNMLLSFERTFLNVWKKK
ncbi:MAG: hypothetical protein JWM28_1397 [Chitinophagaceae bacterium]|nr:hypothetical protein [Chitinophagaceae bacterium]